MKIWHRRLRSSPEGVVHDGHPYTVGPGGEMEVPPAVGQLLLRRFPGDFSDKALRPERRAISVRKDGDE